MFFLLFVGILFFHTSDSVLESCYKCDGVLTTQPEDCIIKKDWCTIHERCLLMTYLNPNNQAVYDARCSTELNCFSRIAEEQLCSLRKNCTVIHCCEDNLCNASDATWIRFDVRLLALVVLALVTLAWR